MMAGIRFDGTITAGNVLTAIGMMLPMLYWGTTVETRLAEKSAALQELERRVDRDQLRHDRALTEIKSEIKDGFQRIENKLDAKADKPK